MGRKIGFADLGYGVTSTAVVLRTKPLSTSHPAAHVRQLLILYHILFTKRKKENYERIMDTGSEMSTEVGVTIES